MNANELPQAVTAPVAIVVGILICLCGYRILKLTLGIMGFIVGAGAGWSFGLSLAPHNNAIGLVLALVAGLIGAALCVWLFFLGVFLLGASAGAIVAAALFNAAGNEPQAILIVICAVVFGLIALVMQKFMIIASTAFSGSYLVVAGVLHLMAHSSESSLLWFNRVPTQTAGLWGYVALACWVVLGLAGLSFQYRHSERKDKAARHEEVRPGSPPASA
jgi:hypothetical protein